MATKEDEAEHLHDFGEEVGENEGGDEPEQEQEQEEAHPDNDEEEENVTSESSSKSRPAKKKRDGSALRKAPQAPKRFKSSYICFFMAKQQEIKDELGSAATVTEVSKRSAEMWRNLPAEERAYWDDVATKDKQRYMAEKATYTGPWQVPWKRAKKDPSAPKRPMSAFLYFSQDKRRIIKEKNPQMRNTEVSRVLGDMWRNASEEERNPHIEREAHEREKYKVAIARWRKEHEQKLEAQRKAQEEQRNYAMNPSMYPPSPMDPSHPPPQQSPHQMPPYGDPNMMYSHPPGMQHPYMPPQGSVPPPYNYMQSYSSPPPPPPPPPHHPHQHQHHQHHTPPPHPHQHPHAHAPTPPGGYGSGMMYSPYPPMPSGSHGGSGGKQMMILGPDGMPQGQPPSHMHHMSYGPPPPPPPPSAMSHGGGYPPPPPSYQPPHHGYDDPTPYPYMGEPDPHSLHGHPE